MHHAAAFGFAAAGVIYGVIGLYALLLAAGEGGGLLGATETPREMKRQPFGDGLLIVFAIGLACHALWRFVHAAFAPHRGDHRWRRIGKRIVDVATGLGAAALAVI